MGWCVACSTKARHYVAVHAVCCVVRGLLQQARQLVIMTAVVCANRCLGDVIIAFKAVFTLEKAHFVEKNNNYAQ